jgi:hypothetical protein
MQRMTAIMILSTSSEDAGLRKLNLGIAFMLAASATSGYNASQINSLLVLPECESLSVLWHRLGCKGRLMRKQSTSS